MSGNHHASSLDILLDDLEAWLGILQSQRYVSEHTLAAYRRDLSKLANFLVSQGCEEWAEVDQDRLTAFIGPLLSTNSLLPTSIQRMLSAMRGFSQPKCSSH